MATVQRLNVILDIDDADVDHYMALGYNVIDSKGNVIRETMPTDAPTLQKCYREHVQKIETLEKKVAELTAELSAKKSTPKASSKKSAE